MRVTQPHPLVFNQIRPSALLRPPVRRVYGAIALCVGWMGATSVGYAQLLFSFDAAPTVSAQALAGFQQAGARWSSLFNDNVTVNLKIDFASLGTGILGSASSAQGTVSYAGTKASLIADAMSAADALATANLQTGPGLKLLMNGTSNSPFGAGSATPFLDNDGDANNTTIRMTFANAKALGLLSGTNAATDASISFSNLFSWDFDPTNGITAGAFDFVGAATHEIGHALGFISGVDTLDYNSPSGSTFFPDNAFTFVSTLDLFRYSADSRAVGAIDWTADSREKYFSIDGGATVGPGFSEGTLHGDGQQASHWKDSLGIGIMDPTALRGELLGITNNDITAFDVIGWNRAPAAPVPEGANSIVLLGLGLVAVAGLCRRIKDSSPSV